MSDKSSNSLHSNFKLSTTGKYSVLDVASSKIDHFASLESGSGTTSNEGNKREKTRLLKSTGQSIKDGQGKIGGEFILKEDPKYILERVEKFDKLASLQQVTLASKPRQAITITMPDGSQKSGVAWETTPMDIASSISKSLAKSCIVAKVQYTSAYDKSEFGVFNSSDGMEEEMEDFSEEEKKEEEYLWDMNRPLISDCMLVFEKFDSPDGKTVFWHSSAHILGQAMEKHYGAYLTFGPPVQDGFYYDAYMGNHGVSDTDFEKLEKILSEIVKEKQPFIRLVVSKDEALDLFKYNPFKVSLISNKIPDGGFTTVYRCGPLIDLCKGPHVPTTSHVQAFKVTKNSGTNWLGKVENDPLQRIYGVSFPDKTALKKWTQFQEMAKEKDHRKVGTEQNLFLFHNLSPGSAFFTAHGTRIYNKLMNFIRDEYWKRGYDEVITPNIYNLDLWHQSGHAQHYKSNMFTFDVEGSEFGMKPMNCPGHCLLFGSKTRSWRDLPMRMADFGVLHRNEVSGALTGLTRVRRFQQDDAHIFCSEEQIKQEVINALHFMKHVYTIFGMTYKLELSTRPDKALGSQELWDMAEGQLAAALDEFAGPGQWRVNPKDGAFYGPKIDIKVFDALERKHQCATVQLDFQMPIRFNLRYAAPKQQQENEAPNNPAPLKSHPTETEIGEHKLGEDFKRPVMVHRAMLGSVERMIAVLTEHFGGKWPFWLSPRQILVVPVSPAFFEYGEEVRVFFHTNGFYCDLDDSGAQFKKKIRNGQIAQYNFILVVGDKEKEENSVNIRIREDNKVIGTRSLDEALQLFKELRSNMALTLDLNSGATSN